MTDTVAQPPDDTGASLRFFGFDHSRFAEWPELAGIGRALDAFAQRCRAEGEQLPQADFELLAATVARHLLASDCCFECLHERRDDRTYAPIVNRAEDGTVEGVYRCERGHTWTSDWSTRAVLEHLVESGS
jgi:hypothetical protein